ncbi:hypothetical protein P154DRAFT_517158 [Amniculicola lignicola CBS 123094]|uniref:Uncharacterized protein n=1 Tax=Amniculicola lignicola CBS 123094 TaxID=1392246 RepID=A0A6A5X3E3_9PLEO|nr:hypothetical protein P154DRAFT_517158 [Amniculicola lignicola CBS 123094]
MTSPTLPAEPPPPPVFTPSFESVVENHHLFYGCATRTPHSLRVKNSSSSSTHDWKLSLSALYFDHSGGGGPFLLQDLPARLIPFFSYKDTTVYITHQIRVNVFDLLDAMYQEWYPTRDRTVFNNGLLRDCGAPYFGLTVKVQFEDDNPKHPAVLSDLTQWHLNLSRHVQHLAPQFNFFVEGGARMLTRPGVQAPSLRPVRVEYTPLIRSTFAECFIWMDGKSEDKVAKLIVLSKDMQDKISSAECKGLWQDVDLEEQVKRATDSEAEDEKIGYGERFN